MMTKQVYAEAFVSFCHYQGKWVTTVFHTPPPGLVYYRIRIPVPQELAGILVEAETIGAVSQEGGEHPHDRPTGEPRSGES